MGRMRLKRRRLVPAWHWRITQKSLDRRSIVEGKVIVYSRPCRRGGMIVRLPQDPSRSGVGKGASCGT
jgi:hypothetical protein